MVVHILNEKVVSCKGLRSVLYLRLGCFYLGATMSLRYCKTFAVAMDVGTTVCRISIILSLSLVGEEKYEGKKWNPYIPFL